MDCPPVLAAANPALATELRLTPSLSVRATVATLRWPPFSSAYMRQGSGSGKRRAVHSMISKPPLRLRRGQKTFVKPEALSARPSSKRMRLQILPFLFWTVHGPFSRFLLEGKHGVPAAPRAVGRGGAKECSEAVAARRLRSGTDFAPTTWGGAKDQLSS